MVRLALLFAALVVGCSSSSGGGAGGGGGGGGSGGSGGSCTVPTSPNACLGPKNNCNPCTKITDAQAAAAAGVPLTPGKQNANLCDWYDNDANGNPVVVVDFNTGTDPRLFACDPSSGFTYVPVSGVGDSACYIQEPWVYPPFNVQQLEFIKGCAVYDITVGPGPNGPTLPDAQEQSEEKALALDAVPNL